MACYDAPLISLASFRGVEFSIISISDTGGRRVASTEFPGFDEPYHEDLGRKARSWSVQGEVYDDRRSYADSRDLIVAACERKGPGLLYHPFKGSSIWVVATDYSVSQSGTEQRTAKISLTLKEAGLIGGPRIFPNLSALTTSLLAEILGEAAATFNQLFSFAAGLRDTLERDARLLLTSWGLEFQSGIMALATSESDRRILFDQAAALQTDAPALLATSGQSFSPLQTAGGAGSAWTTLVETTLGMDTADPEATARLFDRLIGQAVPATLVPSLPGGEAVANRSAFAALMLATATAGYAVAMSRRTYTDRAATRRALASVQARLDMAIEVAASLRRDGLYASLRRLRANIWTDLNGRVSTLAPVREVEFVRPLPSLAVSQHMYNTHDRSQELVARNLVAYPGIMPLRVYGLAQELGDAVR